MTFLIFIGATLVIGLIVGILVYFGDNYGDPRDPKPSVGLGLIVGIIGGIIFTAFYVDTKRDNLKTEDRAYYTYSLVSLDANEDLEGGYSQAFFVGSGHIGEDLYYHFFYNTSKGIKYKKRMAENIYLIETDTIKPSYIRYGEYYLDKDSSQLGYYSHQIRKIRDVLYIPKGTLKRNYKIN